MSTRVGLGYDVHPFTPGRPLVLGGVVLDGPGLAGHSDADAVAHAVTDALASAAGLADLGTMFPASDERWRGADSMAMLAEVARLAADRGFRLGNVSIVVNAETPRLAPHRPAMEGNVLAACSALVDDGPAADDGPPADDLRVVTVTPKRGEGIGAVGRSEGIAVWAVALLERRPRRS